MAADHVQVDLVVPRWRLLVVHALIHLARLLRSRRLAELLRKHAPAWVAGGVKASVAPRRCDGGECGRAPA